MGPGRAQMQVGCTQTHAGHAQMDLGRAQTGPKSHKTIEGHISLKNCPNQAFEVFLASIGNVDAQNTSNARFGQVLSEIWPPEVFGSQNSCGRAQMGPIRSQTGPVCVQMQAGHAQMHVGHAQMGPGHAQMHVGHAQMGPGRAQTHAGCT